MNDSSVGEETMHGALITATVVPGGDDCKDCELILAEPVEPTALAPPAPPPVITVVVTRPAEFRFLESRAIVWGILLVCGPLGLPALWLCPRFSKASKMLWTAVLLIGTVVMPIAMTWYWLDTAMQPLVDMFNHSNH